ncbi:allatostatin-A [Drosophila novamexicana]|uniref:allatostatin-A n=1 Tax=Drosophila novamexicana TaxID=47314 RepID=UPI0011E596AA|nr:allatostatin-A [Drosophila novamexicana]XP_030559750.1 allatostatin-A [Drosophila novamexicana]
MNIVHAQLLLLALYCLGYVCCSPAIGHEARNQVTSDGDGEGDNDLLLSAGEDASENGGDIDKRVERYAFGLGRRAYMYTNGGAGMKRLPVYNFGLGKRSRPYSFGLGKRSDYDYDQENEIDYRALPPGFMAAAGRASRQNKRTTRPQPFNFGLGRR